MQAQHIFACEWNPDALEGTVECRSVIQIPGNLTKGL